MTRSDAAPLSDGQAPWGLVAALPIELGPFRGAGRREVVGGVRLSAHQASGEPPLLAAVSGVGKVAAAHAAAVLAARGVRGLLVVGTCGGLHPVDEVGTLVHATKAVQWDLGVREGREMTPDPAVAAAWQEVAPGPLRTFLTADRAALGQWQRARRARAPSGAPATTDPSRTWRPPRWPLSPPGPAFPGPRCASSPTSDFVPATS